MYVAIYQEDPNDYGDTNITFMEDPYCNFWGKRSAKIAAWDYDVISDIPSIYNYLNLPGSFGFHKTYIWML